MKKLSLILFFFLLTGCEITSLIKSKNITQKFKVQNTIFQYELPEDWVILENDNEKGEIALAQKKDENLIIIQRYSDAENLPETLFKQAQNNFFFFKSVSFDKKGWVFQAKPSSTTPLREFYQKIYPIENSDIFLYASCSYEYSEEKDSDCKQIINSWKILVDKK